MKHEIIYTEHYALIVSDEQAKENDWGYIPFQGGEVELVGKYFADDWRKVIAHRPLKDTPILEGVPLLPPLKDDVEQLAIKKYPVNMGEEWTEEGLAYPLDLNNGFRQGFIDGYNKAKKTYRFSEDDLIECILFGMKKGLSVGKIPETDNDWINNYVKSLQQPKHPKYFKCEIDNILSYNADDGVNALVNPSFGKRKIITNSQGQIEIIGEYIYE
jgi:hypothetical protein